MALERTFALKGGLSIYFTKIVGATACVDVPKTCDLSAGIETDDAEGTVTFHLTRPDAELLYALAMPAAFAVPRGTPLTAIGSTPLPATGAYRIRRTPPARAVRSSCSGTRGSSSGRAQPSPMDIRTSSTGRSG